MTPEQVEQCLQYWRDCTDEEIAAEYARQFPGEQVPDAATVLGNDCDAR